MGWLLRILLLIVVIHAIWRFVRGVIEGATAGDRPAVKGNVSLVRDPVCGTYVVPARALAVGQGRDVKYFCSERCRRTYLDGR